MGERDPSADLKSNPIFKGDRLFDEDPAFEYTIMDMGSTVSTADLEFIMPSEMKFFKKKIKPLAQLKHNTRTNFFFFVLLGFKKTKKKILKKN